MVGDAAAEDGADEERGERRHGSRHRETRSTRRRESDEHHVPRHVCGEHMAEGQVAHGIHDARHHGQPEESGRQEGLGDVAAGMSRSCLRRRRWPGSSSAAAGHQPSVRGRCTQLSYLEGDADQEQDEKHGVERREDRRLGAGHPGRAWRHPRQRLRDSRDHEQQDRRRVADGLDVGRRASEHAGSYRREPPPPARAPS